MAAGAAGGESPHSAKKRSRLQALEHRLSSPPPSKKAPSSPAPPSFTSPLSKPSAGDFKDPTYAKLSQAVVNGSIDTHLQLSRKEDGGKVIDSILRELVEYNEKIVRNIDGVLDSKIQDRVLLLDNPPGHGKAVERARRRAKESLGKRSRKHMSMRQHRRLGSLDLPLQYRRYTLFLPMHEMWKTYAKHLMEDNSTKMIEPSLLQADLHGAILAVVQAKNRNFVGLQGIMVRETQNTFAILTSTDRLQVVPKAGSVFMFQLDNLRITLYGDHLSVRKGQTEKS